MLSGSLKQVAWCLLAVGHFDVRERMRERHYDVVYASASGAPPQGTGNMIVVGVQLWDP
jgi:hypothetical protein